MHANTSFGFFEQINETLKDFKPQEP